MAKKKEKKKASRGGKTPREKTTRKKTTGKKYKKKSVKKKNINKNTARKAFAGLILLILFVLTAGYFLHRTVHKTAKEPSERTAEKSFAAVHPVKHLPVFEIYPKEGASNNRSALKSKKKMQGKTKTVKPDQKFSQKKSSHKPMVAIIIDDIGYDRIIAEKFLNLDAVITLSVLPYSPHQHEIAEEAHKKGVEVMLHLPMEPVEYPEINPGPGSLLVSMTPDELITQLEKDLDIVPFVKGVNNHMGSRMTMESDRMYQIFSVLKKRGLFFIDSRTTDKSICRPSARLLHIPFAQRDVFIDHVQSPEFIKRQLKNLVDIAIKNGEAVGIAHPHTVTYEVLRKELAELKGKVLFVSASSLAKI